MKKRVRLTESQLHRVVRESVKRILKETNPLGLGVHNLVGDPTEADKYNVPDNIESQHVSYRPRKKHTQIGDSWDAIDHAYHDGGFDPSYWEGATDALSLQANDDERSRFEPGSIYSRWYREAEDERDNQNAQGMMGESVVRRYFNGGKDPFVGSFEAALDQAWSCADSANRKKLEQAFPEFFNQEAMYGNENEPFDFRDFATENDYNTHYEGWKSRNR